MPKLSPSPNTEHRTLNTVHYTRTAKTLHWLIALLIIGMLCLGLYMDSLPFAPLKFKLIQFHKSVGITILLLVVARLTWRFTNPAPMLPANMPTWQKLGAHGSHALLYILMFAMPLSGYIMSDAGGYHPNLFGLPVPILVAPNPALAKLLNEFHTIGAYTLIGLIIAHVGAALHHHLIVKDDILLRMLPKAKNR